MTDTWCFTCDHEIRETLDGWKHVDADDTDGCVCVEEELRCQP
jgi:hypothetical protein